MNLHITRRPITHAYIHGPHAVSRHAVLCNVPPRGDLSLHQTSNVVLIVVVVVVIVVVVVVLVWSAI